MLQAPFSATTKILRRHSSERRRKSWPAAPPSTTTTTHCSPHPTAAGLTATATVRVWWKRLAQCKMCRRLNGRIPYLINSNNSRVGAMLFTAPPIGQRAMAVPVSLVAVHTGSLPSPLPSLLPPPFQVNCLPHSEIIAFSFRGCCLPRSKLIASPIPSLTGLSVCCGIRIVVSWSTYARKSRCDTVLFLCAILNFRIIVPAY